MISPRAAVKNPNGNLCTICSGLCGHSLRRAVFVNMLKETYKETCSILGGAGAPYFPERSTCGVFLYRDGRLRGVVVIVDIVQSQKPARHISPRGARVERSYIEMVVVVV